MSSSDVVMLVVSVMLIAFAAFLALAETGLTRMNKFKAIALEEQGAKNARRLVKLMEHPERFLNPLLFLLLMAHLTAGTFIGLVAEHQFGVYGVLVGIVVEVVGIFVFAEAAPKTWAVQHSDRAALFVAPFVSITAGWWPIRMFTKGLIGLSNVILPGKGLKDGPYTSEEELLALADVALEEEVIEREERALIHSIIEFGDTIVREVMVPRPDMLAINGHDMTSDVMQVAITAGYSRLPVFDQGVDDISGIIYTKDLMRTMHEGKGDVEVRTIARKAHFVPETKRVSELMREMQREKYHMAIVVDEYGGTAGVVTLEDLIEELVGEIVDEYDVAEAPVERLGGGDIRVSARLPIDEVNDLMGDVVPEGNWDTIGGFLLDQLGHLPTEGEEVHFSGHLLRAEKVMGRRIGFVRITKVELPEDSVVDHADVNAE